MLVALLPRFSRASSLRFFSIVPACVCDVNIPPQACIPSPTRKANMLTSDAFTGFLLFNLFGKIICARDNDSVTLCSILYRRCCDHSASRWSAVSDYKSCKHNMWSSVRVLLEHVPTALLTQIIFEANAFSYCDEPSSHFVSFQWIVDNFCTPRVTKTFIAWYTNLNCV